MNRFPQKRHVISSTLNSGIGQFVPKVFLLQSITILTVFSAIVDAYGNDSLSELAKLVESGNYDISNLIDSTMGKLIDDVLTDEQVLLGATLIVEGEGEKMIARITGRSLVARGKSFILLSTAEQDGFIINGTIDLKNDKCVFTGSIYLAEHRILTGIRSFEIKNEMLNKESPKTVITTARTVKNKNDNSERKYEYTLILMVDWKEVENEKLKPTHKPLIKTR